MNIRCGLRAFLPPYTHMANDRNIETISVYNQMLLTDYSKVTTKFGV